MSRSPLLRVERAIYDTIGSTAKDVQIYDVYLDPWTYIHTVQCGSSENPPLVLLHGYGACNAYFAWLLPILTKHYNVFCLDHPGTNLSSRQPVEWSTVEECISYFVESLERWREKVGLERMYLAGHSFGGFVSLNYARKYAEHVKALILISPASVTKQPPVTEEELLKQFGRFSLYRTVLDIVWSRRITPFDISRKLGCIAHCIVPSGYRDRFKRAPVHHANLLADHFLTSLNYDRGSEGAMFWIFETGSRGKYPMEDIIINEIKGTPMVFFYGDDDWMNQEGAVRAMHSGEVRVTIKHISNATHQVPIDNPVELASEMVNYLQSLESGNTSYQNGDILLSVTTE
eukprot:TRINITY_DN1831_c0_g3_i2.p1 TRINITY_DN1831_c0_g3~~TRINITY_DN1831_c0_g3_i2.p1  ORF type:complete len:345 (+),score=35.38 TRINITY_DN1831_c0_g3_i2:112-1146(+)